MKRSFLFGGLFLAPLGAFTACGLDPAERKSEALGSVGQQLVSTNLVSHGSFETMGAVGPLPRSQKSLTATQFWSSPGASACEGCTRPAHRTEQGRKGHAMNQGQGYFPLLAAAAQELPRSIP